MRAASIKHRAMQMGEGATMAFLLVACWGALTPFALLIQPRQDLAAISGELGVALMICVATRVATWPLRSDPRSVAQFGVAAMLRFTLTLGCLMVAKIIWHQMPARYALYAAAYYMAMLCFEVLRVGVLSRNFATSPITTVSEVR